MNWYKIAQELWVAITTNGEFRSKPLPKDKALKKQRDFQSEGYTSKIIRANQEPKYEL